jgi:hypothetical protein
VHENVAEIKAEIRPWYLGYLAERRTPEKALEF